MTTRRTLGYALAMALLGAACGSEVDFSNGITNDLKSRGWAVKRVSCPTDRKLAKDDTFTCQATFEDEQVGDVEVTQVDDKGNFKWKMRGVLDARDVERRLVTHVSKPGAEVKCPGAVVLPKKNDVLACTLKTADGEEGLDVTFTDGDGSFTTARKPKTP